MEVWAVEGVAHSILFYLDLSSFNAALSAIQATQEYHGYLQAGALWTKLSTMHFGGQRGEQLQLEDGYIHKDHGWDWTSRGRTCVELQEVQQSIDVRSSTIMEGDIERIDNIDGTPLDNIAFPTSSYLMNPHIGAAGAVFRRAGLDLDEFVSEQSFRDGLPNGSRWLPAGSAVVTPAFNAGVEELIHCVGPSVGVADCYELLGQTYENALSAAKREELQCVAVVSVSTGNLGVPSENGARVALRGLQKVVAKGTWRGKLAVVCNDERVLRAFQDENLALLNDFNVFPHFQLPILRIAGSLEYRRIGALERRALRFKQRYFQPKTEHSGYAVMEDNEK